MLPLIVPFSAFDHRFRNGRKLPYNYILRGRATKYEPITFANPSPRPMNEYEKDMTAAENESHLMLWKSGV